MPSEYAEQIATIYERTENIQKVLEKDLGKIDKKLDDINGCVRDHSNRLTKLEERQSTLAVIGTGISTGISSSVAVAVATIGTWIGWQR